MINYHFHDEFSSDGTGSLALHCAAAMEAGAADTDIRICVTNHAEAMDVNGVWHADPEEMIARFRRNAAAVRVVGARFPEIELRFGVELEYRKEWLPAYEKLLSALPFDFVLGSVHLVDGLNISGGADVDPFFLARSQDEAYEAYFREVAELVEWGEFDVVAHFDLIKRYGHRHYGHYVARRYRGLIEPILGEMARRGIGLEINTSGVFQAPGAPYPEAEILEWARQVGVEFLTLGSDSHAPDQFAGGLAEGRQLAADTGWREFTVYEGRRPTRRIEVAA